MLDGAPMRFAGVMTSASEDTQRVTSQSYEYVPVGEERGPLEPSEAEIEAWAERERKRREAWPSGPTAEEKAVWAWRERERRLAERDGLDKPPSLRDASRLLQRTVRQLQLAVEGGASLLLNLSPRKTMDQLVRAGREWEAEATRQPPRRRRVSTHPN
jgi:hypothetical protein